MKGIFNKIIGRITVHGIHKLCSEDVSIQNAVRGQYIKMKREAFVVSSQIVKVKRGKRKYYLLFVESSDGKIRWNIGGRGISRTKGVLNMEENRN